MFEDKSELALAQYKKEIGEALKRLSGNSLDFKRVMTYLLKEKPLELLYRLPMSDNKQEVFNDLEAIAKFKSLLEGVFVEAEYSANDVKEFLGDHD